MDDSILSKTLVTPGDFALYTATRYAMYRGDILVDEALGSGIQDAIERCHAALTAQLATALSARDTLSGQLAEAREALAACEERAYGPKPGQNVCNCPVCKGDGLVGPDGECCGCVKMGCKDWHYKNPPTNDPRIREMAALYKAECASNKALEGKPHG